MSMDPHLATAANLLRSGQLAQAETACRGVLAQSPRNAPALYLLGLIRHTTGDASDAERLFRASLELEPRHPQAWLGLASALGNQFRLPEAEAAYRQAIAGAPGHAPAHHNLGAVLAQMDRAEEALDALTQAESLGFQSALLHVNRGRALTQLCQQDEAERAFEQAVALEPRNVDAQLMLAQLRYMLGDAAFARDVVAVAAANPTDAKLQGLLADVLRRVGDLTGAENILRDALTRAGPSPSLRTALAGTLHEAGRLKEAEVEALEAAAAAPKQSAVIETLVAIQLSLGRHQEALPFIHAQRERYPDEQRWIAYQATAARLAGDPLYEELYDYDRLVKVYEVPPPPGWPSMEALNAALIEVLNARQPFAAHPLDQSLRNGSQTPRSLLTDGDPVIQAALAAFTGPLEHYCRHIGTDARHPLSARNRGRVTLTGCWSVQLRREGFHLNHVHPQGWISSAYYVSVPDEVAIAIGQAGWLKLGEPRHPVPGATAERAVQPKAGQLALFPSYMWHGTNPIHGPAPRTSIAFDALPV